MEINSVMNNDVLQRDGVLIEYSANISSSKMLDKRASGEYSGW